MLELDWYTELPTFEGTPVAGRIHVQLVADEGEAARVLIAEANSWASALAESARLERRPLSFFGVDGVYVAADGRTRAAHVQLGNFRATGARIVYMLKAQDARPDGH